MVQSGENAYKDYVTNVFDRDIIYVYITVVIGEEDSYLIMISAIWLDTSYCLLRQYYLIQ